MSEKSGSAEERFGVIVDELVSHPEVTPPLPGGRFGMSGLKVKGKIFAMLNGEGLVVKLPKAQVDALVEAGVGERFDPRRDGRVMKEWLVVGTEADWLALAREALEFVGGEA